MESYEESDLFQVLKYYYFERNNSMNSFNFEDIIYHNKTKTKFEKKKETKEIKDVHFIINKKTPTIISKNILFYIL